MKAEDFVQVLQAQAPTRAELLEYGLTDTEIEKIRSAFSAQRRTNPPPPSGHESEAERLLRLYDCSAIEISFVRLNDRTRPHLAGKEVARWEADSIVLLPSGEIAAFDHADPASCLADIAADSERLLTALATLATLIRRRNTWRGRGSAAAAMCAEQAGGERYRAFFELLCGFLDE